MADNKVVIERINNAIENIKNKDCTLFFFVIDSKGIPNGSMSYVYQLAKYLFNNGYNVQMIYQLPNEYTQEELEELNKKELAIDEARIFHSASEWMGKEYDGLPHLNISMNEWKVAPSDFLFIPEVFSSLMFETYKHNIPCKRYVLLQNYNYVTEFIPLGVQWSNYGIFDAICATNLLDERIHGVFPYLKTKVLNPYIDDCFRESIKPKKLIVNIVAKDQNDVNKVIKPFYWKYPIYKFISFRDIRNFPREEYAELLKEGAITVWIDRDTQFGYSPIEAMRCGSIVIGKVPEDITEWMSDGEVLCDNAIWFNNINDVHTILASVIGSWMRDDIPIELTEAMAVTNLKYKFDNWRKTADKVFNEIMQERIKELEETKIIAKNTKEE